MNNVIETVKGVDMKYLVVRGFENKITHRQLFANKTAARNAVRRLETEHRNNPAVKNLSYYL